jgi:hypothetical protein
MFADVMTSSNMRPGRICDTYHEKSIPKRMRRVIPPPFNAQKARLFLKRLNE